VKVKVEPHTAAPWFVEFRFPPNKKYIEDLKRIPGCTWHPEGLCWLVPVEVYDLMRQGRLTIGEKSE